MYSPLTYYGNRRAWLRLFTTRRIVVVALFGLGATIAHTRLISFLPKAAAQATQQQVNPSPTPSPTPTQPESDQEPLRVPPVAPNYEADKATYPQLALIGVSFDRQQTMSLRDVVELALRNNKDIEVSRSVVRSAEATLVGAKGFCSFVRDQRTSVFSQIQPTDVRTLRNQATPALPSKP